MLPEMHTAAAPDKGCGVGDIDSSQLLAAQTEVVSGANCT